MPATFIRVGECAHDLERQALRFIVQGLPDSYTVYGNPWLVERGGVIYELDAVVVAPHAVFVVETKAYRGRIACNDNDWLIPEPIVSPLRLNRKTAQVLKTELRNRHFHAGQVWVEGFVFLSATTDVHVDGLASRERIHTRETLLAALQDPQLVQRLSGRREISPTDAADRELVRMFAENRNRGPQPVRRVREYDLLSKLDQQDTYSEVLARNRLTEGKHVLRIYSYPQLATEEQQKKVQQRAKWEAQVLGRLGRAPSILTAAPPFEDEVGIVLPFEYFPGITLPTWLNRYVNTTDPKQRANLKARTEIWLRIATALDFAHKQGVVHRLLRPEVVLVDDRAEPRAVRVTGFDLAKQVALDVTVYTTGVGDDRLVYAAPEVVRVFSNAEPASDQFSLGALLALLLTGRPIFENTRQLMAERRLLRRVRDLAQSIPLGLDEAVTRMVSLRTTDRFPTLTDAIAAVRAARDPNRGLTLPGMPPQRPLDADHLEPETRIGTDYEIVARLGQGGMAVVYAARHIVSGRTRALKIARDDNAAQEALRSEFNALSNLDHPNIVKVLDLSKMIQGRLTLVMERVGGQTLRDWIAAHPSPEPATQRRFAEDLLAGLDYLENKGLTHKDLKPDNLLVSDGGLTIIDFSLAELAADVPYGGTALYRDPASLSWTHATDRYAAALCLFELYTGRHAFDGKVPEPDEAPALQAEDIQPSGLLPFFAKALSPVTERRFPSARAMRDALLVALGEDVDEDGDAPSATGADIGPETPLRIAGLPPRAVKKLARAQIHTVGDLLAIPASQVRAVHAIGTRTANDIITFQETLTAKGIRGGGGRAVADPPVVPALVDCPEPMHKLPLPAALHTALDQRGCVTVGAVAALTTRELLAIPGIGRGRMAQVVEALHAFATRGDDGDHAHTLERFWDLASRPLTDEQRTLVERALGIGRDPETGTDIAADLGCSQPQVSIDLSAAVDRLDKSMMAEATAAVETLLDGFGGVARLDRLAARLEEEWPPGTVSGGGFLRLVVRLSSGRMHLIDLGGDTPLVARPVFDRETLRAFSAEVMRIAGPWPPQEPDSARRTLSALLPHFDGDPLLLGVRICADVGVTEGGHLYLAPVGERHSIEFVLERARRPLPLDELERAVRRSFGETAAFPDADRLVEILADCGCRVEGSAIVSVGGGSVVAPPPLADDATASIGVTRTEEEAVRDMLRDAATSRGFRMLVTPPEHHAEIGRSVAKSLQATWVSFEDAFFRRNEGQLASLERAERFAAQRDLLTEAAEEVMTDLIDAHGRAGHAVVVGDTALLDLCGALDLPRRLYDETLDGSLGFWVLVIPGVMHNRQPRFNEGPAMWHLEGATVSLARPLAG